MKPASGLLISRLTLKLSSDGIKGKEYIVLHSADTGPELESLLTETALKNNETK